MAKKKAAPAAPTTTIVATPHQSDVLNLNLDLNRDDVVAIQVADVEAKLMAFETEVGERIDQLHAKAASHMKAAKKILDDHAEATFRPKLATLLAAVAAMEEVDPSKLEGVIATGGVDGIGYSNNDDWDEEEYDSEDDVHVGKNFGVNLYVNSTDKKSHYNSTIYQSGRQVPKPAAYFDELTAARVCQKQAVNEKKNLSKARETLAKMGSLERTCRAELAKMRLREIGRADVIQALSKVTIPGLPQLLAPVLNPKK